jgi:predicted double-glycine peptidase
VPLTRQNTDYTCGVTSLQAILGYYGIDKRLDELSLGIKPDPDNGTNYLTVAAYTKSLGFDVAIRTEMTIDELKGYIDQRRPVLLAIQAWADSTAVYSLPKNEDGHYVVAIGYDDKNFYFMDPSTLGHYTYIPTAEFVSRWHDYDSFGNKALNHFGIIITKDNPIPYNPNEITRLD